MKKFFLPILFLILAAACSSDDYNDGSDDDGTIPDPSNNAIVRIASVDSQADEVVLTNLGTDAIDVGNYFLCLGPGTYAQISNLTTASTTIAVNGSLSLTYDVNPSADGLGVFTTDTFASTDPAVLLDYVQWGAANQPRVDQAVTAGRWDNASNFVDQGSPYQFTGNSTDFGSNFWESSTPNRVLRIFEVDTDTDAVVLYNFGNVSFDIADYWLCLGPGTYAKVGDVASTSTNLAPGEMITLTYDMNPTAAGLGLFSTNSFSSVDPTILIDYVQWGAANQARVDQAVAAGRWNNITEFVDGGSPYNYTGTASDVGVAFWE